MSGYIVPLPDFKVRIRCTEYQRKTCINCSCPSRFDPDWCDYTDCNIVPVDRKKVIPECEACWSQYVIWEVTDAKS